MAKITDWANCYDDQWKGLLWEDKESGESAFSHPAKMARGLVFRIIEYALQNGLIQPGQTVVDCFGGVGTTALPCLMNGLNYIGVELEPRFVTFGRKNIDLWNAKFSSMPKWTGTAQLLQGDSRRLAEVIAGAGLVVSSPPYVGGGHHNDQTGAWGGANGTGQPTGKDKTLAGYGGTPGQLGQLPAGDLCAVISSPPFAGNTGGRGEASRNGIDAALFDRHSGGMKKGTGSDPANLDHLPMGQVGAVIASPPFTGVTSGHDSDFDKTASMVATRKNAGPLAKDYGSTSGQLGAMVVGSPPFENSLQNSKEKSGLTFGNARYGHKDRVTDMIPDSYGDTDGQIGNTTGETFWAAARLIVDQCHQILPDNAAAIWVVKSYVKNGKVVDFPGQWQALCEACGFETVEIIRAWLVKHNGAQGTIEGGTVSKDVARKSFFRRLAESKGSPPIDYETVLVTRKRGN